MANILLVEDDDMVRMFVSRALELDDHEITHAENGLDALEILEEYDGDVDLILSDIRMPGMDGIALAHQASKTWNDLRILLMTGFADQRERCEELMKVVIDVVDKPFSLKQIREAVDKSLIIAKEAQEAQEAAEIVISKKA